MTADYFDGTKNRKLFILFLIVLIKRV